MNFFRKKSFDSVRKAGSNSGLAKTLTAFDLVLFGLGAIIGTGVFVLTGTVAANHAGPAVMLSYAIAGFTCIFVALAYTELAVLLPTSGSVYTYSYVAFGEMVAWLMGSVIIVELNFGAATVAAGWSAYVVGIFEAAGYDLPDMLTKVPSEGGIINLPALLIVALVTYILYLGTKDSKRLNAILVFIKMAAIIAFVAAAVPHFDATHWENFMPKGFDDVLIGASILFFAFTGFGSLAATAEECKNPKRDLMIGIIGSLVLSTAVYVFMAGLVTGLVPYYELNNAQPLAKALVLKGSKIGSVIVATGAVCGMTTVMMMQLYAQSRIFYAISRDGLLPKAFSRLHHKYDSPYFTIIFFSTLAGLMGSLLPYNILGQLSSMGALVDYIVVSIIVMIFRYRLPDAERSFKCPALFFIAPAALLACIYLLSKQVIAKDGSLLLTGKIMIGWFVAMFILYLMRSRSIPDPHGAEEVTPS